MRMIEIYSTYRNLHARTASTNRVKPKKTSLASLAMSPFKWRYIKNPWVYAPTILSGLITYLNLSGNSPLSDAQEIVMFGNRYSPYRARFLASITSTYQFALTAIGEEMYFRGILQTELTEHLNPNLALVASSLIFGAFHIPNKGLGNSIGSTLVGGYLGYRYKSNGYDLYDLGEVIASHFYFNFLSSFITFIKSPSNGEYVYKISWKL